MRGTKSWDEVISRLEEFAKTNPDGWLTGRGWDQNDWEVKKYPTKEDLDAEFPNIPVVLNRIDGHAMIVNSKALSYRISSSLTFKLRSTRVCRRSLLTLLLRTRA